MPVSTPRKGIRSDGTHDCCIADVSSGFLNSSRVSFHCARCSTQKEKLDQPRKPTPERDAHCRSCTVSVSILEVNEWPPLIRVLSMDDSTPPTSCGASGLRTQPRNNLSTTTLRTPSGIYHPWKDSRPQTPNVLFRDFFQNSQKLMMFFFAKKYMICSRCLRMWKSVSTPA